MIFVLLHTSTSIKPLSLVCRSDLCEKKIYMKYGFTTLLYFEYVDKIFYKLC